MSGAVVITAEARADAVRRLRSMLRWSNPSGVMRRAIQTGVEALLSIAPGADLPPKLDWTGTGTPRERLIAVMTQCPINSARADQLRAGAMTTSLEDCAIQAITHALAERATNNR